MQWSFHPDAGSPAEQPHYAPPSNTLGWQQYLLGCQRSQTASSAARRPRCWWWHHQWKYSAVCGKGRWRWERRGRNPDWCGHTGQRTSKSLCQTLRILHHEQNLTSEAQMTTACYLLKSRSPSSHHRPCCRLFLHRRRLPLGHAFRTFRDKQDSSAESKITTIYCG